MKTLTGSLLIGGTVGLLISVGAWLWHPPPPPKVESSHGLDVQHASIERCRRAGGFPVMGFAAVVCVEPSAVKWSEEVPWQ